MALGLMRGVVLSGLALCCARPRNMPAAGAAGASAVRAPGVVGASASASASGGEVTARLEVGFEMQQGAGASSLMMLVSGRERQLLRVVPEPYTCEGVAQPKGSLNTRFSGSIACKPGDANFHVDESEGALWVRSYGERDLVQEHVKIPIAPKQPFHVDMRIRGNGSTDACSADAPSVPIDVKLGMRRVPAPLADTSAGAAKNSPPNWRRVGWFEVPKLGVGLEALEIHRPEFCGSLRVRKRLTFWCVSQEAGASFVALAEHGVLSLSTELTNYGEDYRNMIGAVKLPCGAKVSWPRFRHRDPEWTGVGTGKCGAACSERRDDCEDRCRTKRPDDFDDEGSPHTDAASACFARCESASQHCGCPLFG